MKRILTLCALIIFSAITSVAQHREKPYWVDGNPHNQMNFTGIASASKSEQNYQKVAKDRAYMAIASEIKVDVSAESILYTLDIDDNSTQSYEENIKVTTSEHLERVKLVDTWQDDSNYWVFYELNRFDYEEYMQQRLNKAISTALEAWVRGNHELDNGNIVIAAKLFTDGLTALEPVISEDLRTEYNGRMINLPIELRSSLMGIWNDVDIEVTPNHADVQHLKAVKTPFVISCTRNGAPISGLALTARFVSGGGKITPPTQTDINGNSELFVTSITSKLSVQQIEIDIVNPYKPTKNSIGEVLLRGIKLPNAIIVLKMGNEQISALLVEKDMQLPSLTNNVKAALANNYFDLVSSVPECDIIMELSSGYNAGEIVRGDMFNSKSYYGQMTITMIDNHTDKVIAVYNIDQARALIPEKKPETQGRAAVIRELIKRLNRELPRVLSQVNIDLSLPRLNNYKIDGDKIIPITSTPTTAPQPQPSKEIKGLLDEDVWLIYNYTKTYNERSRLYFTILNQSDKEYKLSFWCNTNNKINVYNEKGGKVKVYSARVGDASASVMCDATIVRDIPTELMIEIDELKSVALFNLFSLKLRGLR